MTSYRFDRLSDLLSVLGPRLRIAVIYGGDRRDPAAVFHSTYNVRPWTSYREVAGEIAASLERLGFAQVVLLPEDRKLVSELEARRIDLAWLNTGGVQGINPMAHAASLLEMLGIPYVGHDPFNASRLDNKDVFKRELRALGFDTPPFMACPLGGSDPIRDPSFERAFGGYPGPFVVKPASGRASLLVDVVDVRSDLREAVRHIQEQTRHTVLIERYLPGREYCVAVCGPVVSARGQLTRLDRPFAFSPIERLLEPQERVFTSKDTRPITASRAQILDRESQGELRSRLLALGERLYEAFGLRYVIRVDVRADEDGSIQVLEANPKPDLRPPSDAATSLVALGLDDAQMTFDDLLRSLLAGYLDEVFGGRFGEAHSHLRYLAGMVALPRTPV